MQAPFSRAFNTDHPTGESRFLLVHIRARRGLGSRGFRTLQHTQSLPYNSHAPPPSVCFSRPSPARPGCKERWIRLAESDGARPAREEPWIMDHGSWIRLAESGAGRHRQLLICRSDQPWPFCQRDLVSTCNVVPPSPQRGHVRTCLIQGILP